MLERAVTIVEDADAIPQLGLLGIGEVVEGLLVGRVGLLQIIQHEVAVAQTAPDLSVVRFALEDLVQVLDCIGEIVASAQDGGDGEHGGNGEFVEGENAFVGLNGAILIAHEFG